jgi:hypothetical protein
VKATVAPNVWMHKRGRPRAFAAAAGVNAVFWLGMYVLVALVPKSPAAHVVFALIFLGVVALSTWVAVRAWKAGLRLTARAAEIRGPLRSHVVPLDHVAAFEPGVQAGIGNGTPCVVLHGVDGRELPVWALGREGLAVRYDAYMGELQLICDDLNAMLRSLRTPARGP